MIRITANGQPRELEGPVTVLEFLRRQGLHEKRWLAVERNGEILFRREYDAVLLADGDVLEIVHAVGGG